jgi:nicotinamidase-related amidase
MDRFDLHPASTAGLVIDVQERFLTAVPSIAADQPVGRRLHQLLAGLRLLHIPLLLSEQYPQGLGATLPAISAAAGDGHAVAAKTHFSCIDDPALKQRFADMPHSHVIVAGIEAHVCVLGTVADLIAHGKWVVVAADAVASRDAQHTAWALEAMASLGALVLPVESILFRLQRQAGVGAFKQLSALVK